MAVPKLRFEGFSEEWKQKRLIELCDIFGRIGFRGYTVDDIVSKDEGVLTLSPGNINTANTLFLKENNTYITHFKYEESPEIKIQNRDILFVKTGSTLGKFCYVENLNEPATINPQLIVLKNSKINPKFISILLGSKNIQNKIAQTRIGGAVPTLTQNEFGNYASFVPSTDEANKISVFFELIDKKIQLQQEKIDLLKEQKKGFMQKIFSQELRFKDEDGQEFPEWEERKLNDFAEKITIKNKDLKVRNVISNSAKNGLIAQTDYFDKEIANQENINGYYVISNGDFVYNPRISSDAPYGPINIYNGNEDGIVSPLYTCFKVKNINKKFLYQYFKSSEWYKFIYLNGDSGARHDRVSIKDTTFLELPIRIPSPEEQTIIAKFLSNFQKKINFEELKLKTQLSQKEAFMQQMFI